MSTIIGVDISKDTLDIAWVTDGKRFHFKLANNAIGHKNVLNNAPVDSHFVMEATGVYHLRFAYFLSCKNCKVSVVNPLSIKRFGQMELSRTKTDKADAFLIARYGSFRTPAIWKIPKIKVLEMKQLLALDNQYIVQKVALQNQVEAFTKGITFSKTAQKSVKYVMGILKSEIKIIEQELEKLSEELYPKEVEILTSIPGIGTKTAKAIIIATDGFSDTPNGRALCRYFGISPHIAQSGTSLNISGRITKVGQPKIRALLYMCSLTAIKTNVGCKNLYDRLRAAGKPAKVALIAVTAKLVRQMVSMIKKGELYNEEKAISC